MLKRLIAAVFCFAMLMPPAFATRVSPMVVNLEPVGRSSIGRVEVGNTSQVDVPVEARVFRGEISETGDLSLTPADDDFIVFPTQIAIPPNGQQVFRLQYVGNPELAQSEIYYLSIRQIPVVLKPTEPTVQIVSNFNVLVNVLPRDTRSEPVVDWAKPVVRDSVAGIEVRLSNKGTRAFSAGALTWRIDGSRPDGTAASVKPSQQELAEAIGVGVVAPGKSRIFFIPTKDDWKGDDLAVTIN